MENRIIFGLGALAAIVEGLAGGMVPMGLLPLLLVVLGLAYGFMSLDAEDSTMFVAVAIGLGAATQADVLSNIHVIGTYLDAITDQLVLLYYGGVVAIVATRVYTRVKG